jgi:hypothetical protein
LGLNSSRHALVTHLCKTWFYPWRIRQSIKSVGRGWRMGISYQVLGFLINVLSLNLEGFSSQVWASSSKLCCCLWW